MRITKYTGLFFGLLAGLLLLAAGVTHRPASAQEPVDQEKLNRGARLYQDNCAVCHGENGEGRVGASLTQAWPSIRPDLTVQNAIENGIPGSAMPAWSQANGGPLTEPEIDHITAYVVSLQPGAGSASPEPTPAPEPAVNDIRWLLWLGGFVLVVVIIMLVSRRAR